MTFDTNQPDSGVDFSNNSDVASHIMTVKPVYKRLGDLFLSEGNVRSADDVRNIPELAAMIASQGLMNALQISLELDEHGLPTGRGAVEAGGRRYRALMLLVEQGKASLNDMIECKEVPAGKAKEISLVENLSIQAMHPADEYAAYQDLVDEGKTVEFIANTHGVEVLHVKRRLKLAAVHPELIALFRKGDLTLDLMAAFASCDDKDRQLMVWQNLSTWERNARSVRNKLAEDEIEQDDPRVKVIGLQNYLAAGGTLKEDLFSEAGEAPALLDLGLVEMLVGEAMQVVVDQVTAEGWAWVRPFSDYGYQEQRMFSQLPKQYREPTAEEQEQRQQLEAKRMALSDELDALNDEDEATYEDVEAKEAEIEAVEAQEAALQETLVDGNAFDKTVSGAIVAITRVGVIEVFRGMVERTESEVSRSVGGGVGSSVEKPKAAKPDIPESLMKNLTSHRTAAVQAAMLTNQDVSLAALAHTMALSIFSYVQDSTLGVRVTTSASSMKTNSDTVETSRAGVMLSDAKAHWLSIMPKDKGQWFAWFLNQPQQTVLDFIVYGSAVSTDLIKSTDKVSAAGVALSNALDLDMTQWWTATPDTFFGFVPKSKLAAIIRETAGDDAAKELDKMKKDAAIAHAVKHTEGKNWLPAPLRVQVAPVAVDSDLEVDTDVDEDDFE